MDLIKDNIYPNLLSAVCASTDGPLTSKRNDDHDSERVQPDSHHGDDISPAKGETLDYNAK